MDIFILNGYLILLKKEQWANAYQCLRIIWHPQTIRQKVICTIKAMMHIQPQSYRTLCNFYAQVVWTWEQLSKQVKHLFGETFAKCCIKS